MSDMYYVRCVDSETKKFVGYLKTDYTTVPQKSRANVFPELAANIRVTFVKAYGKYDADTVKKKV